MTAVSLRLPEQLVEKTTELAKTLQLSRTEYISRALERYNRFIEQQALEQAMAQSASEVREQTHHALNEWDSLTEDNLNGDNRYGY